eukprot:2487914-Prorocentrum_lima.AAC.1
MSPKGLDWNLWLLSVSQSYHHGDQHDPQGVVDAMGGDGTSPMLYVDVVEHVQRVPGSHKRSKHQA